MNFMEEFRAKFGEKYDMLHLKDVSVRKNENVLIITFLYPSSEQELTVQEKNEIIDFFKDNLELEQLQIRVKFMKAYAEEKLIMKAVNTFFETKHKAVNSYLSADRFSLNITPIDVLLSIELSPRMVNYFAENKVSAELSRYLKDNFLVNFEILLKENVELNDEVDIVNVEMKTAYKPIQRYNVEIVKEVIGKGIMTRPEYLSFITGPKNSVVVAGFIKKIERKEFIAKKGKFAGQPKSYFVFQIQDEKGKIDCINFPSKANVKVMEALEEYMYVLLHGDVKFNQLGKLSLQVDKIALATKIEKEEVKEEKKVEELKQVVEIEKLTALEQDSMFEQRNKYNNKIMGKTIVVFDIETTGLDPNVDQIIELGAVKVVNGNMMEKFSTFVRPTVEISREVESLTGISQEMVENAPPVDCVIKDFYEFCKDCVVCGHNAIDFDLKFIKREAELLGLEFDNPVIDTLKEARVSKKLKISRFNLGAVVKALGLSLEGAHRAWNDAYATAEVLLKLNEV